MILLLGILPISIAIIAILHVVLFKFKIQWLNWIVLTIISGALMSLVGFGTVHAGFMGIVTFIVGFVWLKIISTTF